MNSPMKVCIHCGEEKVIEEYNKDSVKKDGYRSYCKRCDRELARGRAERVKNSPKIFVSEKMCQDCKVVKHRGEFWACKSMRDGLSSYCKTCGSRRSVEVRKKLPKRGPQVEHKICPSCGADKLQGEFYREPSRSDGLSWECRVCTKRRVKRWAEGNMERKKEIDRRNAQRRAADGRNTISNHKWRQKHPRYKQEWRSRNIEYARRMEKEYARLYRRKYPERVRKWVRESEKKNPMSRVIRTQRRNARKRALPFDITKQDIADMYEMFRDECAFCGCHGGLTLEHVVPVSRDDIENPGTVMGNLIPLCRPCNASKGDKLLEEYLGDEKALRPEIVKYLGERRINGLELAEEIRYFLHMLEERW